MQSEVTLPLPGAVGDSARGCVQQPRMAGELQHVCLAHRHHYYAADRESPAVSHAVRSAPDAGPL